MAQINVPQTNTPRNGKYLHFGNIIEAARALTGSQAKTREGAWRAIRTKHLPRVYRYRPAAAGGKIAIPYEIKRLTEPGWHGSAATLIPHRDAWRRYQWQLRAERGGETIMRAMGLATRWESIIAGGSDDWERALVARSRPVERDGFGALNSPVLYAGYANAEMDITNDWLRTRGNPMSGAQKCIAAIESRGTDEHGGWAQYVDFDKHGRGSCINVDVYGIDDANALYVIQVRQFQRRYKNGYGNVRKTYFLIGYNENGNPFAHPVSAHKIHAAIKRDPAPESPVRAARAWIWGIDEARLDEVLRNGDTALIPSKRPPREAEDITPETGMMRVVDSHFVYSREIRQNGATYALDPTLRHFKGQHPTVRGRGWYKIMVGNRADHHDFAKPTVD